MNTSGITPTEFNVLISQEKIEDKTPGGLIKPEDMQERERYAQTKGVIIAVSPLAFNEDVWPESMPKPEPGQAIVFARHAGVFVDGDDGKEYRIIKDKDVVGLRA